MQLLRVQYREQWATFQQEDGVRMLVAGQAARRIRTAVAGMIVMAAGIATTITGCTDAGPGTSSSSAGPHAGFAAPQATEQFRRALRTDLCALVDPTLVSELGWQVTSQAAQNLVACGAATADLAGSVSIEMSTADGQRDGPASGDTCSRVRTIEQASGLAARAVVTTTGDPCGLADRFAASAAQRFAANAGTVEPPNQWIALDACELLRPALADSATVLGGPRPSATQLRRIGLRGCLASHEGGTAELSVTPAAGAAADLDGDEVDLGGRTALVQRRGHSCALLLLGEQLGGGGKRAETQVVTVTVAAEDREPAGLCETAQAMARTVASALPG
jgi:hypothetical protein